MFKTFDVVPVCDTSALADGDVIATAAIEIANQLQVRGQGCKLISLALLDEADQGIALDVVFGRTSVSLGTANSAPNISDANARELLGIVNIATGDYVDLGGARLATKANINLVLTPASGTSLYVSFISRGGTPTYAASSLKLRVGVEI